MEDQLTPTPTHVCPFWVGYLLASPIRKLIDNPDRLIGEHVRPGMTVLDLGCAMGYFSLPMARMVGDAGQVICLDVQERMLRKLEKRAERAGLLSRTERRLVEPDGLGLADLDGAVGFALAFAVMHEIPDQAGALAEVSAALAPGARMLIAEPRGHVNAAAFERTLEHARAAGLRLLDRPQRRGWTALLVKE